MTDIVERLQKFTELHGGLTPESHAMFDASTEIESLRQQLAECQAREKMLRDALMIVEPAYAQHVPSDSTALDTLKRQWQREALCQK